MQPEPRRDEPQIRRRTESPRRHCSGSTVTDRRVDRLDDRRGELQLRRARRAERRRSDQRFDERFVELRAIALGAARRVVGDPGLSEEIAQEALHRAFRRWDSIESYAEPWTSRVATNLAIDRVRRRREQSDDRVDVVESDDCERVVERVELRRAFDALTPRLRRTLELRIVHQLDPDEAAADLGCSRAAVLKNTTRGLRIVREALASSAG